MNTRSNGPWRRQLAVAALVALIAVLLSAAPAQAAPDRNSICYQQTSADAAGDRANLDIIRMRFWSDCRRFYVELTTDDSWGNGRLSEIIVEFDLDRDRNTGCDGADAIAGGVWRADVSSLAAATITTPSCDEATWRNNGQGNIFRPGEHSIQMHVGKNTLGNDEFFDYRVSLIARGGGPDVVADRWFTASNPKAPRAPGESRLRATNDGVLAIWTRPDPGDGAIRDFEVEFRIDEGTWFRLFRDPATPTGSTTTRATIRGVDEGEFLEVRVRAVNDYGYGPWSGVTSFGPPPPTCAGVRATIVGTDANDVLRGTPGADVIVGLGGNDLLIGFGGKDILCGDDGRDWLLGGAQADQLFGGEGPDVLKGGSGRDLVHGGQGNDRLFGNNGDDQLFGDGGRRDTMDGRGGNDLCQDRRFAQRVNCES